MPMPVCRLRLTAIVSQTSSQGTSVIGTGKCCSGYCTMRSEKPQERDQRFVMALRPFGADRSDASLEVAPVFLLR